MLNLKALFDQFKHILAKFTTWLVSKSSYVGVLYLASILE